MSEELKACYDGGSCRSEYFVEDLRSRIAELEAQLEEVENVKIKLKPISRTELIVVNQEYQEALYAKIAELESALAYDRQHAEEREKQLDQLRQVLQAERDEKRAIETALEVEREKRRWIPVTLHMPTYDDGPIKFRDIDGIKFEGFYNHNFYDDTGACPLNIINVIEWQPLPELPEEEGCTP